MLTNAFMITALVLSAIIMIEAVVLIILITKIAMRNKAAGKKSSGRTRMGAVALFLLAAFPAGLLAACIVLLLEAALLLYAIIYCIKKLSAPAPAPKAAARPVKPEPVVVPEPKPEPTPEPEPEPTPEPLPEIELHETITMEEAHSAMADEVATAFVEIHHITPEESAPEAEQETAQEQKSYSRKEIINIDTLSVNFNSGDTVNLDTLKEKGLIPKKTDYIKVLARGTLDKHLTVEANEYSADAIKMIVLTGGKVIKDV